MDIIRKAILFGGKAIVSVVDAKQLANDAINAQGTTGGASEVLARSLAFGAFLSAGIKGTNIKLSISIEGDGSLGKIIVAGMSGGVVRGYVENRSAKLPLLQDGKYDIASGIGANGTISIIKDFGMKEPYMGKSMLVNGTLDADLAYYLTVSEQLPSAVASGAIIGEDGVAKSCGVIVVQPMPNCEDEYLVVLQDIVRNFTDFGQLMIDKTVDEIIEENFGHFECKMLEPIYPRFECQCSQERMDNVIRAIGLKEARQIVRQDGRIEIHCDFCNKYYRYTKSQVEAVFGDIK